MVKKIFYYDDHLNNNDLNARVYSSDGNEKNLIFTGFMLNEFLSVSIKNSWGKDDNFITQILDKAKDVAQNISKGGRTINSISGGNIGEFTGTTEILNSKFVTVSDYYKSFNGTEIKYPELKVTYYGISDKSGVDITSRFKSIIKRFVGEFKENEGTAGTTGRITAPNGFTMPLQFNTTTIKGSYYIKTRRSTYRNLLCSGIDYKISPQRTQEDKPVFIIAEFSFVPGSLVTLNDLTDNHIR